MKLYVYVLIMIAVSLTIALPARAQDDEAAELAKKLANPIASLVSVPIQYDYDANYGQGDDGSVSLIEIQPVIPFSLNDNWNLITRTIIPFVDKKDIPVKGQGESGLGDISESLFFSPKEPTEKGWIWGAGPVFLLPTASDEMLGSEKWGLGPSAVVLKQVGPWTAGGLFSHTWSVAGDDDRDDISATFLQPFVSYVTKTKTTLALMTESTYDWENSEWSIPAIAKVGQMLKVGPQIMQLTVGARYWLDSPENGPEGWGLLAGLTLLYPF